jgi:hypothetical protein
MLSLPRSRGNRLGWVGRTGKDPALRQRHASFDRQIQELSRSPSADREIATLTVEKLRIKDEITSLTH